MKKWEKRILDELVRFRLMVDIDASLRPYYERMLKGANPNDLHLAYIEEKTTILREIRLQQVSLPNSFNLGIESTEPPPEDLMIEILYEASPLQRLNQLIDSSENDWHSNERTLLKSYIFACFSELTYQNPTGGEAKLIRKRYRVFPSDALRDYLGHRVQFDTVRVFLLAGGLALQLIERPLFLYCVFKTRNFNVVAVRGTASFGDWGINLDLIARSTQDGGFHRGFYKEASSALPLLIEATERGKPLYFTGHSLGGAVASVLAQIWPESQQIMIPYIFGSPRFAKRRTSIGIKPHGYVTPDDLIPHLPPRFIGFANYNFPPETVPPHKRWLSGVTTLLQWITPWRGSSTPHSIERYRQTLGKQIGEDFPRSVYLRSLRYPATLTPDFLEEYPLPRND